MTNGQDGNRGHHRGRVTARAARAGGDIAAQFFRTSLDVESKDGKTDVVTQVDRDAQDEVIEVIRAEYPDDPIIGEESDTPETVPAEGPAWIVDPIDGTSNFVRGNSLFACVVAAVEDGEAVAATTVVPATGDEYRSDPEGVTRNGDPISVSDRRDPDVCTICPTMWWDFDRRDEYKTAVTEIVDRFGDLRRYGSTQLELATVASGGFEGAITNVEAYSWDTVAGVHMIRQAGGTVTDLDGSPWRHDSTGLVASNGRIHDELLDTARAIDG